MNLGEALLSALSMYGIPLLCGITAVASIGAPLPVTLLLIAAGSFADHGEMNAALVIAGATASAVAGDQIGFWLGRWGDRRLAKRISRWLGSEERLEHAEAHARKWGGTGIFLSRWLVTPLGPFVNLVSGFAGYPWHRFLLWDILGELLWVVIYVEAGRVFSHEVQDLNAMLGNISWSALALLVACIVAWKLVAMVRAGRNNGEEA